MAEVTETIKSQILKIFPDADFNKYKYGVPKKHPLYERFRSFARKPDRAIYNQKEDVAERRRISQNKAYQDPIKREKILEKNKKFLTKPDKALDRRKYLQDKYYYGGQREKDLLRLKGKVASKGYGGYFKNPDNALLKDMVRMAEQNPDSGLEVIRKGPRNLIVGVKEGDTIYSAVASKRKPVAYAPKNSIPITEHPDFKTRFEFTKLQKNFSNTKIKGTDLTYGKALDILQSSKAGSALQNKNPAEFEHIKGVATDYKEGQIALRTANRDKQVILSALENNNITLNDADQQLKKIGVRAFVDNKYIGAPTIDAAKQFEDLKKYVDRNINKVDELKKIYDDQPKGSPIRKYFEKNIAKCADGCFVKVANKNPEKILKNSFNDQKLIRLFRGESFPQRNMKSMKDSAKFFNTTLDEIKRDKLSGQWFSPDQIHADGYNARPGQLKYVDVTPTELESFNRYKTRVNKLDNKYSTKKRLNLPGAPKKNVTDSFHHQIIPRYKLKQMEDAGRMKTKYTLNPFKKQIVSADPSNLTIQRASGVLEYDNVIGGFIDPADPTKIVDQAQLKTWAQDNPMPVRVGEEPLKVATNKSVLKNVGRTLATIGAPLPTALIDGYFINEQVKEGKGTAEIASNPLNWLGLATMSTLSDISGVSKPGKLNTALRLGLNPGTIRGISRFAGLPGLAVSTALTAYDQYKKYQNEEGFIYNLFNKEEK